MSCTHYAGEIKKNTLFESHGYSYRLACRPGHENGAFENAPQTVEFDSAGYAF